MRSQRFGVEIEMTGLTREAAARVIAGHFGTGAASIGGYYGSYTARDENGRDWTVMSDSSIRPQNRSGISASNDYSVELVTPILCYEDIGCLQGIVRKLRRAGARVNDSCGIHVHVDAGPHTPKTLKNIVNIVAAKEDILYKALNIHVRREHYCKKTDTGFLERINRRRQMDMAAIGRQWYGGGDRSRTHYDDSRYRGLNLHSVFSKGTIEFRLFNSTLHAGEVKSYIQLCLAISHQALVQQRASHAKTVSTNEKYTFRTWLLHLGMIGKEFETARLHLLKNLSGNIAWKDPAQARERKPRSSESVPDQAISNVAAAAEGAADAENCSGEDANGEIVSTVTLSM